MSLGPSISILTDFLIIYYTPVVSTFHLTMSKPCVYSALLNSLKVLSPFEKLFTCSTVRCQIHDISPPNLVGGHDHPFHSRNGTILWSSTPSLHMPETISCQLWIINPKGSGGETVEMRFIFKVLMSFIF